MKIIRSCFRLWNDRNRIEAPFLTPDKAPTPLDIPVLMVSGGADALTPVDWAQQLYDRFEGLTHFIFPYLGHAVAFGYEEDVEDPSVIAQLRCGPKVIDLFLNGAPYGRCARYLVKGSK